MIDMSEIFNSGLEEIITVKGFPDETPDVNIMAIVDIDYSPSEGGFKGTLAKKEAYTITGYILSKDLVNIAVGDSVSIRGKEYRVREIVNEQTDIINIIFGQKTT